MIDFDYKLSVNNKTIETSECVVSRDNSSQLFHLNNANYQLSNVENFKSLERRILDKFDVRRISHNRNSIINYAFTKYHKSTTIRLNTSEMASSGTEFNNRNFPAHFSGLIGYWRNFSIENRPKKWFLVSPTFSPAFYAF